MKDQYGREIEYLRVSVTDRCNERCLYCMPEEGVPLVCHEDVLTFDEILRLVRIAAGLGIHTVRLTGGEPLVRRGLPSLIEDMKRIDGINRVAMTTNGTLLKGSVNDLVSAGLDAVNISLDTCNPALYRRITRTGRLEDALAGLDAACSFPSVTTKIDCVMLGLPEQKLTDVASLAKDRRVHVRFIELMPIGSGKEAFLIEHDGPMQTARLGDPDSCLTCGGTAVSDHFRYVSLAELKERLEAVFGPMTYLGKWTLRAGGGEAGDEMLPVGYGPANYYKVEGFVGRIGMIGAVSSKFCHQCNRVRLTAQGFLKTCLQYDAGVDLRELLRSGGSDEELEAAMRRAISQKPKEHRFGQGEIAHEETKYMSAIGG